jgi:sulfite oxidase
MLGELFSSAVICEPLAGDELPAGNTTVRGYAIGHGGRRVEWVEVSADGGQTWAAARLLGEAAAWAWRLWEATVELAPGPRTLVARVADPLHPQPDDVRQTWNFKGYMNNAWHRVAVNVIQLELTAPH